MDCKTYDERQFIYSFLLFILPFISIYIGKKPVGAVLNKLSIDSQIIRQFQKFRIFCRRHQWIKINTI